MSTTYFDDIYASGKLTVAGYPNNFFNFLGIGQYLNVGTNITAPSGYIQPQDFKSSDGSTGITQTIVIRGSSKVHTLTFKNGILTNYSSLG